MPGRRKGMHALGAPRATPTALEHEYDRLTHELRARRERLAAQHADFLAARRQADGTGRADFFEQIPMPAFVLDANGAVCRANLSGVRLVGVTEPSRMIGTPFVVFVNDAHRRRFLDHMLRCRDAHGEVTSEITLQSRTGATIPVRLASQPTPHETASDPLFLTAVFDLRERLQADAERRRAAEDHVTGEQARTANDAKDRFLAMLSHELRAPLTPILLSTSTWKDRPSLPDEVRHAFAMIHRNAEAQARLVDDLLDLTRIARGKLQLDIDIVDPHAIIEDVLDALQSEAVTAGVALERAFRSHGHVRVDPLRLRQIVTNLGRNAIRFTPPHGRVTIATRDVAPGRLELTVTDTGFGFDEETHARMFEPFDQGPQLEKGGLGLGLAICRGLVLAQQGTISAHSDGIGRGARFVVELPATDAAASSRSDLGAPHASRPLSPAGRPLRILLVEDHEDTATVLALLLEQAGYEVRCASCVADALAIANRDGVDVLVSDLGLPDGSGLDLMRTLHARMPVRGVALTGHGREQDLAAARTAGFARHLTKPVELETLLDTIASLAVA